MTRMDTACCTHGRMAAAADRLVIEGAFGTAPGTITRSGLDAFSRPSDSTSGATAWTDGSAQLDLAADSPGFISEVFHHDRSGEVVVRWTSGRMARVRCADLVASDRP